MEAYLQGEAQCSCIVVDNPQDMNDASKDQFSFGGHADRGTTFAQPAQKNFKSPDGTFEFQYSSSLVTCQLLYESGIPTTKANGLSQMQPTRWRPSDCSPVMDVCPDRLFDTGSGPDPDACVAYPTSRFSGTNFDGRAFSVHEITDATTEKLCLQFDQLSNDPKKTSLRIINGITFMSNEDGEAGLGHSMSKEIYLTFHDGNCYDLEIRTTESSMASFDPGAIREFKNYEEVHKQLRGTLNSFRFTR